jgi:uncharacterized membrane protein YdbT with pleckstrin-like domain
MRENNNSSSSRVQFVDMHAGIVKLLELVVVKVELLSKGTQEQQQQQRH